ncbi:competence protein ComK [Solibacillus sp. FSL K6-1523]|uniref:competence protein ComK n=1 Tax=Solibacillus sp. FSL K6-1523 TaxID=2921471 RepID=UPI0030F85D76
MLKNLPQVSNYIASNSTYFLKSISHREKTYTLVSDKHGKVIYPNKPLKIIRSTCRLHGSSYQASQYQAKQFFGKSKHKLPIMIAYDFGDPCVLFPLFSPNSLQNIWISFQSIINIVEHNDETIVTFLDGSEERLPLHCKSFNHQYVRASMFYKHLILKRNSTL